MAADGVDTSRFAPPEREAYDDVRAGLDTWSKLIVPDWTVTALWYEGHETFPTPDYVEPGWVARAMVECSWPYRRAGLSVNLKALRDDPPAKIRKTVVHELSHALVVELFDQIGDVPGKRDHLERVVCHTADALCRTADYWYRKGKADARKSSTKKETPN